MNDSPTGSPDPPGERRAGPGSAALNGSTGLAREREGWHRAAALTGSGVVTAQR